MSEVFLQAAGLCKSYGGKKALDGLNLTLESGKCYALLGDPGSGRSTLLRCVAGLCQPDQGELRLFGQSGDGLFAARRELGMLVDQPRIWGDMSIQNNLRMQSCILGGVERKRMRHLMKLLAITPRTTGRRNVGGCPLALKLKCAIAMSLLGSPRLLLLDEVFGGLDTDDTALFRALLEEEMAQRPMSVLLTGQFFSELFPLATDYLLLEQGRITARFTREELEARLPEQPCKPAELETWYQALRKEVVTQ